MNKILNELFEIVINSSKYEAAQQVLSDEICKSLEPYKESMSQEEYEQLRGIAFFVSHMAMKQSFVIGFQTGATFLFDCIKKEDLHN
jgi:hypothetical protein